jgi:hypothetical protein
MMGKSWSLADPHLTGNRNGNKLNFIVGCLSIAGPRRSDITNSNVVALYLGPSSAQLVIVASLPEHRVRLPIRRDLGLTSHRY